MGGERNEAEDRLDKYVNDISGIEPETDEDIVDDGDEDAGDDDLGDGRQSDIDANEQDVNARQQDQDAGQNVGGKKQKDNGKKGQQPGKGQPSPKQNELRPFGDGTFTDAKGNIVDKNGNIIAQNGFARRMYEQNRRQSVLLNERTQQLNALATQVGEVRSLAQSIQRAGITNDETARAIDLASRMKKGDVVGVAKEVVALALAQGYNATDILGTEVGDTLEMRAVQRMLDERLAPITRQEQVRTQQQQLEERARTAYESFVANNEYADVHGDSIVRVMQAEQCNAQQAYNRLYQFAVRNQLDFSRSLEQQLQERAEQEQRGNNVRQQNGHQQNNSQTRNRPMPNGANTGSGRAAPAITMADANDDWGSIISSVQQTLGVQ